MSAASTGRKFNSKAYVTQNPPLEPKPETPTIRTERPRTHRAKGQYGG